MSRELMRNLGECAHICNDCFMSCLNEKDVAMMIECIELCKECSTICTNTIALVYKGAHFKKEQLELCIKACEACATECEKHNTDHNHECARACRHCADACRKFMNEFLK